MAPVRIPSLDSLSIVVVGLGYVGLPLAAAFSQRHQVIGYDINQSRVAELNEGIDKTQEVSSEQLETLEFSTDASVMASADVIIVTVPTPVDRHNYPDLAPLEAATQTVARYMRSDSVVIFESTVYPGATEEFCIPILESLSGLRLNEDFACGYSPERINPGDKKRGLKDIVKVTSGSSEAASEFIDSLYKQIIEAGTFKATSIRVAEAAKAIENTQRDVNIALVNEFAMMFKRMGIESRDVLAAAQSKWNFLPFKPGLVGGHCIGVDPYYLIHKAQEHGYHPELILAARRINSGMARYVTDQILRLMALKEINVVGSRILVLGLAFKENCPDLRNTQVVPIIKELESFHAKVDVFDPWVDPAEAHQEYGIELIGEPKGPYDAIVLAVAHDEFENLSNGTLQTLRGDRSIFFDVKGNIATDSSDGRL